MVPETGLGLGLNWDGPRTVLQSIKCPNWDGLRNIVGQSQDSLRMVLGMLWDYLGTELSSIAYGKLGRSQDRLRTGTGLGQDWDWKERLK